MRHIFAFALALSTSVAACAQERAADAVDDGPMSAATFTGLEMRNIGPAFMSGRIADIALDPSNPSTWYVAVGSGGVWKTANAGTTWTPIFDDQSSYSIGDVTVDPSNPSIIWVGTGENVGGRHVGYGDGVYRSRDGGQTWENLGLIGSERISKILIHPDDSNTVWVAAQGPLWSPGGDRGLFKTTDGGENWTNVLSAGVWTGVTDFVLDPRDPDRIYAATWQRHRTVAAYVGGGPETGLHVSEDGGETWREVTQGLPDGNMGKIGLGISADNPDVVYAAIETNRREGGVWVSTDRGETWEKRSDAVGGGTGPHYYQEIYVSPHDVDRVYLASNYTQVSSDGARTFESINLEAKHVDDHALVFRDDDPDYVLIGSDGGLYESYDRGDHWRFIDNLPVTQFYKVAVDDAEPFYTVYGGTQDNNTQGGPSRTDNVHGIRNADWYITLGGDGHQPATEPGNPDIMYSQWQQGNLNRIDRTTGESIYIKPQAQPGEPPERWNWDAPVVVSSFSPTRLYHASQRVWRSEDRGDTWAPVSGDLTRNEDRMQTPHMGRRWSWDAGWDIFAMSKFNTITSLSESPLDENLLYVGTDDGLIQVTTDGGETWRSIDVSNLPGVPERAFVNDIKADLHDVNTVYVALDNHKEGDFAPYLFKSTNQGRTWTSMGEDLPERHLVWRIVQDHIDPDLFFLGTEFGVFFSVDAGDNWVELEGGMPTISIRDLAIQKREDDLVAASFGRGFFILDDYSALRAIDAEALEEDALLFAPGRRAWWYIEREVLDSTRRGSQGDGYFVADNPPFGAVFTYYLREDIQSLEDRRQEREEPLLEEWADTPFPGFDAIQDELREDGPHIWLTVRDSDGAVVRRLKGPTEKGFHRIAWDLRHPAPDAVVASPAPLAPWQSPPQGFLAMPGEYTVSLSQRVRGVTTELAPPQPFTVTAMRTGALEGATPAAVTAFWDRVASLRRAVTAAEASWAELDVMTGLLAAAIAETQSAPTQLDDQWQVIRTELHEIDERMNGNLGRRKIGELLRTSVRDRMEFVWYGVAWSTYGPTPAHEEQLGYAEEEFAGLRDRLNTLREETIPQLQAAIIAASGPHTPGAPVP